jgi:hypothetical protein
MHTMNNNVRKYYISSSNLLQGDNSRQQVLLMGYHPIRNFTLNVRDIMITGLNLTQNNECLIYMVINGINNPHTSTYIRGAQVNNGIYIPIMKSFGGSILYQNASIYHDHFIPQNIEHLSISLEHTDGVKIPIIDGIQYHLTIEITEAI